MLLHNQNDGNKRTVHHAALLDVAKSRAGVRVAMSSPAALGIKAAADAPVSAAADAFMGESCRSRTKKHGYAYH